MNKSKLLASLISAIAGAAIVLFIVLTHNFVPTATAETQELGMKTIGHALMGSGKQQYLLPFEAVSILLLAALIGCIVIAMKSVPTKSTK